jgi:predicted dehydrogenase
MSAPPRDGRRVRLALVGARQTRHGLGPHLARHLTAAGAEIVAVVGSRLVTAQAAAEALAPVLGHRPLPLAHADDLERVPDLDGLVIASPHETHAEWLRWAVGRGLHVLCEKPFVWGGEQPVTLAGALARRFQQRGLHLVVNAQWPLALDAVRALHPDLALDRVQDVGLEMAPPSRGPHMLPDALPHALSLLYALAPHPRPRLEAVEASFEDEHGRALNVALEYHAGERVLRLAGRFTEGGPSPRPFALTLDGHRAAREVEPRTYAMSLTDGPRRVALPDPMAALARRFVERLATGAAPEPDPSAVFGVEHLVRVAEALPALPVTEIPYP